jgi:hypothetical protein
MEIQEAARAEAHGRRREARTGQMGLFTSTELHNRRHYEGLRERYCGKSRHVVQEALQTRGRLLYDDAWELALAEPLTWESDLKDWIKEWQQQGTLEVTGVQPGQRVPRLDAANQLVWK